MDYTEFFKSLTNPAYYCPCCQNSFINGYCADCDEYPEPDTEPKQSYDDCDNQ